MRDEDEFEDKDEDEDEDEVEVEVEVALGFGCYGQSSSYTTCLSAMVLSSECV